MTAPTLGRRVRAVGEDARTLFGAYVVDPYWKAATTVILVVFGLTFLMWLINVSLHPMINLIFFFPGAALVLALGFSPVPILTFLGLGGIAAALGDRDTSQGIASGPSLQYKVVMGALFAFMTTAGFLSTWSFKSAPFAFFLVFAMILLLTVTWEVFGSRSIKTTAKIVTAYAVAIIVLSLWTSLSFSDEVENTVSGWFDSEEAADTPRITRPSSIYIPSCASGWSDVIGTPRGVTLVWGWAVTAQSKQDNNPWVTLPPNAVVNGDALRFCSDNPNLMGRRMPLGWS